MEAFPILVISMTAYLTKKIIGSWISPGVFFSTCWTFFLIFPLLLAPNYNTNITGLWYIVIFSMSCSCGAIIAHRLYGVKRIILYYNNNYDLLIKPFYLFILISFLGLFLLFNHVLDKYNYQYYNINYFSIPNLIAIDRYSGNSNYPIIIKYSLYCIYPSNLIGGLILSCKDLPFKIKAIAFSPLLAALLLGIIEGARSSILLGLILFFSAWLSSQTINENYKNNNQIFKVILGGIFFTVGFTLLFIIIQWLRQGMDSIVYELIYDRVQAYFFGYLAAFTQWVVNIEGNSIGGGLTTFAGPFNLIGIIERPLGFYEPISISSGISTNIFTAFRGIVNDFSISGSIIIVFIIGFISQVFFQNITPKKIISTLPLSMFYAFTLYSPLISIFHYNSIMFSWLIVFFVIRYKQN
tara:strand:- start:187 stop:1416 length:1230 start_codon:yes stop_codon:yes gene_type:complete